MNVGEGCDVPAEGLIGEDVSVAAAALVNVPEPGFVAVEGGASPPQVTRSREGDVAKRK